MKSIIFDHGNWIPIRNFRKRSKSVTQHRCRPRKTDGVPRCHGSNMTKPDYARASHADVARHNAARNDLRRPAAERASPNATDPFARHVRRNVHLRRRGRRPPRLVRRAARQSDSHQRARRVRRARQGRDPARQRGRYAEPPPDRARRVVASRRRPKPSPAARPSARRDVTRSETEMNDRRDPKKVSFMANVFASRVSSARVASRDKTPLPLVPALSTDPVVLVFLASRFSNTPPPQLPRRTWR
jgi:hypothetical protein